MPDFDPTILDYRDSTRPVILGPGKAHYHEVSIMVEPNGGTVELQLWSNAAQDWYTPTDAEHTINTAGAPVIERLNRPPLRIIATGAATFAFFGGIQ